jgi:glutaredoxin-related protein
MTAQKDDVFYESIEASDSLINLRSELKRYGKLAKTDSSFNEAEQHRRVGDMIIVMAL